MSIPTTAWSVKKFLTQSWGGSIIAVSVEILSVVLAPLTSSMLQVTKTKRCECARTVQVCEKREPRRLRDSSSPLLQSSLKWRSRSFASPPRCLSPQRLICPPSSLLPQLEPQRGIAWGFNFSSNRLDSTSRIRKPSRSRHNLSSPSFSYLHCVHPQATIEK
jgi:hypothetical protein